MLSYKETAKGLVIAILNQAQDSNGQLDLQEIANGNNQKLLEHIVALSNIFNNAKTELEEELNNM